MVDPETLASRLLKLEQQLSAYEKLHADELTELRQALNEYRREVAGRPDGTLSGRPGTAGHASPDTHVRTKETSMPSIDILSRLAAGDHLLLDGATGSELQHRGVNVSKGMASDGSVLGAWSATAMVDAPEVVRAIHEDYLRVGADIITANSYNTNRGQLRRVGMEDRMEEFSRLAIELARQARDKFNAQAYVAGSIAPTTRMPFGWDPKNIAPPAELLREWTDQSKVLAEAGADLILIETMTAIFQARAAVQAAKTTGLPVFLAVHPTVGGTMESGETMQQLVEALSDDPADSILLMCQPPEAVSATLPNLRQAFQGPIGAYANVGYGKNSAPLDNPARQYHELHVRCHPTEYADFVKTWLGMGAQIVGACCGSSPEHIALLRQIVK
jgi:S-methylmethionine-dependent homocysteine/selenocysteine methylase